jgi:hypothetical protein
MILQDVVATQCPCCGEAIQLLVDCSGGNQQYIEDCQVCCRPIQVALSVDDDGLPSVTVRAENGQD